MNAPPVIRIGTRGSLLALAQARLVAAAIERTRPPCRAELVPISTKGDRWAGPLDAAGRKGLFTAELEAALRDGRVQLAVHSAKDLPAQMPADLVLAGAPSREDPRDALVTRCGGGLADLPPGAAVGTGSLRRAAQLKALRPDLKIVPIRGNVETRIRKVLDGKSGQLPFSAAENGNCPDFPLDAVILAMAGLKRSGLLETHKDRIHPFPVEDFVPAAGQGTLALQCTAADAAAAPLFAALPPGAVLVAVDLAGRAPDEATVRGETARAGLAAALVALGAARLRTGADDGASLAPEYVTMPRGVTTAAGEVAWLPARP